MAIHGRTIEIKGNVDCVEDVLIEGRVTGHIWNEAHVVTVGADATVTGDIVARTITIRGTVDGTMMATGRVDVMDEARVTGRVLAPRFMLAEGASFNGKVEPQHLDAALKVARHRRSEALEPASGAAAKAAPVNAAAANPGR
jgi:cytoskeletal protein CcmA (bactofilin family)